MDGVEDGEEMDDGGGLTALQLFISLNFGRNVLSLSIRSFHLSHQHRCQVLGAHCGVISGNRS